MGSPWLRRLHPGPPGRLRLVCLPHAGGAATFFRTWSGHLPHWVDVVAVQYPGRQERIAERHPGELSVLAADVAAAVTAADRRPVALFGHSMGAALAYEVAVLLHRDGRPPVHLAVSGHCAPSRHRGGSVHLGTDDELVAELSRLGGTDVSLFADPEWRALALPALRADYRAAETYAPAAPSQPPPLRCRITTYHGTEDPEVTEEQARAWSEVSTGRFGFRAWPGGHFYLTEHESALVKDLGVRLAADDPAAMP